AARGPEKSFGQLRVNRVNRDAEMIGDKRRAARALPQQEGLIPRAQKLRGESVSLRLLPGARIVSGQTARAARGVDRTVDRVRLRTELFEPPMQFEMAQLVQNHLEPRDRVVVVLSVVIKTTFGRFEQRMAVLQKVRICGDEFDLVFIFQVVYDSFEQAFFSAADLTAAVSRPLSGSFQRSHFCSFGWWLVVGGWWLAFNQPPTTNHQPPTPFSFWRFLGKTEPILLLRVAHIGAPDNLLEVDLFIRERSVAEGGRLLTQTALE